MYVQVRSDVPPDETSPGAAEIFLWLSLRQLPVLLGCWWC